MTTRLLGDMRQGAEGRHRLRKLLPADPLWLRQVHGVTVCDADSIGAKEDVEGDAFVVRRSRIACAIQVADCMPVVLTTRSADVIGIAHAGWRGLSAGILEATLQAMQAPQQEVLAWLGPAIGPLAYEVGDEVREAFLAADDNAHSAFTATRPGHWLLDLYAVAEQRLARAGVTHVFGGRFCTYTERERFFSFRRDSAKERMAALAWLV
ncbi:MAG TPA: peptidoglycan editing factor PgeF [Burkholderiales bacterium]|nr:peptidoglycan editing factor PgeF [Burkholderiales bacterium]